MLPTMTIEAGVYEDPALQFSQGGKAWVTVKCILKDRRQVDGQWVDDDDSVWFVRVKAFGRVAENVAESVKRGDTIIASGRLQISKWKPEGGEERTYYDIVADMIGLSLRFKTYEAEAAAVSHSPSRQAEDPIPF